MTVLHDEDFEVITISELLKLFNLELDLPQPTLELEVDPCIKKGKLITRYGYIFSFEDYTVIINHSNPHTMIIESQNGAYLDPHD